MASVKRTYDERFDSRTGSRSYMPLNKSAPLQKLSGRFSSRQPRVSTHPARCEPDECAEMKRRLRSPPKLSALRQVQAMARRTCSYIGNRSPPDCSTLM